MAAKKKIVQAYGSKTQFVMGLPHDMSAKEVVARGKAKGLVLSEAHVYKIRSTNKSKAKGAAPKAAAKGAKKAAKKVAKPAKKAAKKAAKPAKKAAKTAAKAKKR